MNCRECKHSHFYTHWSGRGELYYCDKREGSGSTHFTESQKRKMCEDDTTQQQKILFSEPFLDYSESSID